MVQEHRKIRSKATFHQSLMVLVILTFYEVVQFATGALSWAPATAILATGFRS